MAAPSSPFAPDLWRILVDHGEEFLSNYDSRYEDSHGPLPKKSEKVIYRLVRCGDPRNGLSLLHCPDCRVHMGVPYSCKTRVCPSCVNRRAEVLAHSLAEKLPEGDYRHLVIYPAQEDGPAQALPTQHPLGQLTK